MHFSFENVTFVLCTAQKQFNITTLTEVYRAILSKLQGCQSSDLKAFRSAGLYYLHVRAFFSIFWTFLTIMVIKHVPGVGYNHFDLIRPLLDPPWRLN